eukprot:3607042-Prymnesium_polylepis.2
MKSQPTALPTEVRRREASPNYCNTLVVSAQMAQQGTFTNKDSAQTDANGQVLYGMDKELADKAAAKFDPKLEADCKAWLEALTGAPLPEGTFQEALKDG